MFSVYLQQTHFELEVSRRSGNQHGSTQKRERDKTKRTDEKINFVLFAAFLWV